MVVPILCQAREITQGRRPTRPNPRPCRALHPAPPTLNGHQGWNGRLELPLAGLLENTRVGQVELDFELGFLPREGLDV
jgi:hypothetical protein